MIRKWFVLMALIVVGLLTARPALTQRDDQAAIRGSINRSLVLLQASASTFHKNAGCASCHSQSLGAVTFALAREHGFNIEDRSLREANEANLQRWESSRQRVMQGIEMAATIDAGYAFFALSANHYGSNKATDALIHHLAGKQSFDGHWRSVSYRPPLEYSEFTATALTVKALQQFAPPGRKREMGERVERARAWLIAHAGKTNEERVFRLLGLRWSAASESVIQQAARELLGQQRTDGGWAQLDSLASDAYATGQALYALHQAAGLATSSAVYQNGIRFLLKTQLDDGSWLVTSRSFPVVPPVESGFPHGKNQFISAAGSSWATIALVLAIK